MSSGTYEKVRVAGGDDFSDSEGEDDGAQARTSEDVRRRDRETLTAEEEAQRLLGGGGGGGEKGSRIGKFFTRGEGQTQETRRQSRRASRRERRRRKKGEESSVMYEMEEGGPRSSSAESSGHSSEVDMQRLGEVQARQKVWLWL